MKTLDTYLCDPDIADEPLPLREIHAIRLKIQDETKNMTPTERARNTAEQAKKLIEQYGLNLQYPKSSSTSTTSVCSTPVIGRM